MPTAGAADVGAALPTRSVSPSSFPGHVVGMTTPRPPLTGVFDLRFQELPGCFGEEYYDFELVADGVGATWHARMQRQATPVRAWSENAPSPDLAPYGMRTKSGRLTVAECEAFEGEVRASGAWTCKDFSYAVNPGTVLLELRTRTRTHQFAMQLGEFPPQQRRVYDFIERSLIARTRAELNQAIISGGTGH